MKLFPALFLIFTIFSHTAIAHESVTNYNQVSLTASVSQDVENDTMIVSMYAQEEGSKASLLSNKVNEHINWAINKVRQHKDIKVETESYTTTPVYNKSKIVSWRVRQSIKLESKDTSLLSEVLGELQLKLKLNGVSFIVSREKNELYTKTLIDQALAAFTVRAKQIASQLQHDSYKIVNMNISTSGANGVYPRTGYARMSDVAMSAAVTPEMASGERTLSVKVNGTIELD